MVTSVIELADALYKANKKYSGKWEWQEYAKKSLLLASICSNANDLGLPLLVVQQLLKGTDYEQLI